MPWRAARRVGSAAALPPPEGPGGPGCAATTAQPVLGGTLAPLASPPGSRLSTLARKGRDDCSESSAHQAEVLQSLPADLSIRGSLGSGRGAALNFSPVSIHAYTSPCPGIESHPSTCSFPGQVPPQQRRLHSGYVCSGWPGPGGRALRHPVLQKHQARGTTQRRFAQGEPRPARGGGGQQLGTPETPGCHPGSPAARNSEGRAAAMEGLILKCCFIIAVTSEGDEEGLCALQSSEVSTRPWV